MTVLANEQVIDGRGWRSGALVEKRKLSQWFLKITEFAEELLDGLGKPRQVARQGPADAGKLDRQVAGGCSSLSTCRTVRSWRSTPPGPTRSSARASSPSRPIIRWRRPLPRPIPSAGRVHRAVQARRDHRRRARDRREAGLRHRPRRRSTRSPARHLPVYIANFVLMEYGTGAVMGVPGHDQRDFEFASKYGLPIMRVIAADAPMPRTSRSTAKPTAGDGVCVNSGFLDGMSVAAAKAAVIAPRRSRRLGRRARRSGGCATGAFRASAIGARRSRSSTARLAAWCRCPRTSCRWCCPRMSISRPPAIRSTAIRPGSMSPAPSAASPPRARPTRSTPSSIQSGISCASPASPATSRSTAEVIEKWLPVEQYIGGIEHAILHLLYARFWTRALAHIGADRRQGAVRQPVHARDGDARDLFDGRSRQCVRRSGSLRARSNERGERRDTRSRWRSRSKIGRVIKMSKSKKNVVDPDDDHRRLRRRRGALVHAVGQPARARPAVVRGRDRGLRALRPAAVAVVRAERCRCQPAKTSALDRKRDQTVAAVAEDIDALRLQQGGRADLRADQRDRKGRALGQPLGGDPHAAAAGRADDAAPRRRGLGRAWAKPGLIADAAWPPVDPALLVEDEVTIAVQVMGKLRDTLTVAKGTAARGAGGACPRQRQGAACARWRGRSGR